MAIKTLYRNYFHKSRVFLYPLLDINRKSINPIQTYISWEDQIDPEDMKLICLHHIRDDIEFRQFEKLKLLGNKLFHSFIELEDNKGLYIFDFSEYKKDWNHFLNGKYSLLSPGVKKCIKDYFRGNADHFVYIESYLEPQKYYNLYAELLNVDAHVLKEAVELTDKPLLEKENLLLTFKTIEFKQEKSE
jgi:hypothetical protein